MDDKDKKTVKEAVKTSVKIAASLLVPGLTPIVVGQELVKYVVSTVGGEDMGKVAGLFFGSEPDVTDKD